MIPLSRLCGRQLLRTKSDCDSPLILFTRGNGGQRAGKGFRPRAATASSGGKGGSYLLRPVIFTVTTVVGSFSAAAILKYESLAMDKGQRHSPKTIQERLEEMLHPQERKAGDWRQWVSLTWDRFSAGEKIAAGCIFLNVLVFLAWRSPSPAVQDLLRRYFTSSPFGKSPCLSMFLSTFSHESGTHLAVNMIGLWSFAPTIVNLLGPEQTTALYLSAGMSASLFSYAMSVARQSLTASIGASGAILGLAAAVCAQFPDAQISIIFLPMFAFAAKYALGGMICMDVAGIVFRWRLIDHAGHLGGTLFGLGFISVGQQYVAKYQKEILKHWHQYRMDS